jgi:energy-coupling factor transporter ATP-binding protein EcfA2
MLTGREHLRFQATLRGIGKATAAERTAELLDRVGLTEAADRRVGGYSGGMKRRLDLAMALVHQPAILFLDEPTTGLDLQSRAGLWDEVARLARDDGATVFLTTQYLEEADVLADRVGIIDHGKIVAEGTPARLKAELGPPTVEIRPAERDTLDAMSRALERFAAPVRNETGTLTVPLPEGERQLAELVRALDQAGLLTVSWALIICESMMQAVGCAARPWYWRSSSRSRVMSARGRPRPFHRSKNAYAASHGGRSTGRARHSTPFLTTYATASHIARRSCTIGRPAAMVSSRITSRARGSSTSHWASVRSEG